MMLYIICRKKYLSVHETLTSLLDMDNMGSSTSGNRDLQLEPGSHVLSGRRAWGPLPSTWAPLSW